MPIKTYRLIFLTLVILLLIEAGLEFRAQFKGWNTILGGLIAQTSNKGSARQSDFGPSQDFPFRSLIVPVQKEPGTSRLWIASSSYAQDNYFNASKIFPSLLGEELNQSGFRIQVLNAAQEGQSIEGNLKVIKEIAAKWKPDYILLYQMNNDINELSQQYLSGSQTPSNTKHDANEKAAPIKPKVNWGEKFIERTTVYQLLKENVTARLSQSRILVEGVGNEIEDAYRQRIYDFINTSRSIGATPVLCTFATSQDLRHPKEAPESVKNFLLRYNIYLSIPGWFKTIDKFNEDIRQIGKEQHVPVIDLSRDLSGKSVYFRDFVHFTPEGHQWIAQYIAKELLEKRSNHEL